MTPHLPWYTSVGIDAGVWAIVGLVAGYGVHRIGAARLDHDAWWSRPRGWEREGRAYRRWLRVDRWQSHLPEAGPVFAGGIDKRQVGGRSTRALETYATETRRGELAHWLCLAATPLFVLWNPPLLFAVMIGYAAVANVPCIVSLRYNRLRLGRILRRRHRASARER
ncbi:MAG: hypothetical protein ACHQNA_02445 [Acidimicrobiales bacterium]